jgi:cell division protein FtsW (lipid II flippase)
VLVAGWGVLTRVRHRLAAGLVVVTLSLLVLVVVPMVDVARRLQGAEIWLALAAVGLLAIVLATLLERGRRVATHSWQRLRELTSDWQ